MFVLGFALVFVSLGLLFGGGGLLFARWRSIIDRVAGALVILFGLNTMFDWANALNRELRFHPRARPRSGIGAMLVGAAFGAGWTPCVGPALASILFMAGAGGDPTRGAALLAVYAAGLGLPFLVAGAFVSSLSNQIQAIRVHARAIRVASGALMTLMGLLIELGSLSSVNASMFGIAAKFQNWGADHAVAQRAIFGAIFLALAAFGSILGLRYARRSMNQNTIARRRLIASLAFAAFTIVMLSLAALVFAGVARPNEILAGWLRFQGI